MGVVELRRWSVREVLLYISYSASDTFMTPSGGEVGRGGTYQVWSLKEYTKSLFNNMSTID